MFEIVEWLAPFVESNDDGTTAYGLIILFLVTIFAFIGWFMYYLYKRIVGDNEWW